MKPADFFYSNQQLDRYLCAVDMARKLKAMQDDGYLIFDEDLNPVNGGIFIRSDFSKDSWDVVSIKEKSCTMIIVGLEYWDDGRPWIASKKTIKACLGKYCAVDPKDIKRVK